MMEAQFGVQQYLVGEERQKFADALGLNQVNEGRWKFEIKYNGPFFWPYLNKEATNLGRRYAI